MVCLFSDGPSVAIPKGFLTKRNEIVMTGDYVTITTKARGKESWFLGAITDENARIAEMALNFLTKGEKYKTIDYENTKDADWQKNPIAYKIRMIVVTNKSKINLNMAPAGGTAISFEPIQ
ncbi:glycoside hydrolase family 97 C-terminal domain-containing protein [Flavobacterium gawalongense]|nr:glycoside hydrolase family 97 C-terminal domain-containing protein [Flavobacterium gawalongense]